MTPLKNPNIHAHTHSLFVLPSSLFMFSVYIFFVHTLLLCWFSFLSLMLTFFYILVNTANVFSATVFAFFAMGKSSLTNKLFFLSASILSRAFYSFHLSSISLLTTYKWKGLECVHNTSLFFRAILTLTSKLVTDKTVINTHKIIFIHTTSPSLQYKITLLRRADHNGDNLYEPICQLNTPRYSR